MFSMAYAMELLHIQIGLRPCHPETGITIYRSPPKTTLASSSLSSEFHGIQVKALSLTHPFIQPIIERRSKVGVSITITYKLPKALCLWYMMLFCSTFACEQNDTSLLLILLGHRHFIIIITMLANMMNRIHNFLFHYNIFLSTLNENYLVNERHFAFGLILKLECKPKPSLQSCPLYILGSPFQPFIHAIVEMMERDNTLHMTFCWIVIACCMRR